MASLPHTEVLVLTQWCTYADADTQTYTACLIHCHCHLSVKLPLQSNLFYFNTFPSSFVAFFSFFLLHTLSEHSKSTEVLAKSKTENESIKKKSKHQHKAFFFHFEHLQAQFMSTHVLLEVSTDDCYTINCLHLACKALYILCSTLQILVHHLLLVSVKLNLKIAVIIATWGK